MNVAGIARYWFFLIVVRPIVQIVIGLNVRHRERLPTVGPAVVIANHNSHLDTFVLMCLFAPAQLRDIHPVAAADYFLSNRYLAWFALNIIGILPIDRDREPGAPRTDPLAGISTALEQKKIVILFPEGTRGEPEKLSAFKSGVAHLVKRHPDVPAIPIFLHGLGKALPRGEAIFVPFFCDVFIGPPLPWTSDKRAFMTSLDSSFHSLASEGDFTPWE